MYVYSRLNLGRAPRSLLLSSLKTVIDIRKCNNTSARAKKKKISASLEKKKKTSNANYICDEGKKGSRERW